ncbi:FBD-associated F-box protein At3g52670-like [Papaver somniferum]|uniref:FBD-associated F-box protein At3g52670-like n=1 Tax=Papaver somniferum TaxID=3469 RepID=UPI000E6FCF72|nr:FBD-associated F-box protein At3g52670-like [Papaver somniferum]
MVGYKSMIKIGSSKFYEALKITMFDSIKKIKMVDSVFKKVESVKAYVYEEIKKEIKVGIIGNIDQVTTIQGSFLIKEAACISQNTNTIELLKNEDRISILQDDLLLKILDLVDMKTVVRTSVLSTGWRYIWKSVSVIKLAICDPRTKKARSFIDFVNTVVLLRDISDIKTFVLNWDSTSNELAEHLTYWILVALSRNVQKLHIEINSGLTFALPHQLFISQTLTELTLYFGEGTLPSDIFLPNQMCLHRLESLSLNSFGGGNDITWINKLLSSSPVLNSLKIMDTWVREDDAGVNVDCPQLKHPEIINTTNGVSFMAMVIKLSTPSLTSFIRQDYMLLLRI